jgi:hypothetical protein
LGETYVNDFARPAYFQDVSYEIAQFPTDISFRTVRISVLGADNSGIRYKILSKNIVTGPVGGFAGGLAPRLRGSSFV